MKTPKMNGVALISTLDDAKLIDSIDGNHYLQDRFKECGPIIGGPNYQWLDIIKQRDESTDGVAWFRSLANVKIYLTATKLVAAYQPGSYSGSVLKADYSSKYGATITLKNTGIQLGHWTKSGLADLITDLNEINEKLIDENI